MIRDNYSTWDWFLDQFGAHLIVPVAIATAGVKTKLPVGVIGKVPSVYNTFGDLVGYHKWQTCRATLSDIDKWKADGRYGFGVITGQELPTGGVAIAIDCDTENQIIQQQIYDEICASMPHSVAMRVRINSGRRAYLVRVKADHKIYKRILRLGSTPSGKPEAIEILGHGQQLAVWGTHPSGAQIEWLDLPADHPGASEQLPDLEANVLTGAEFDALLERIVHRLGDKITGDSQAQASKRGEFTGTGKDDDVARYLDANGYTIGVGKEGERYLVSPFAHEYSGEQGGEGDTSLCYFLPGTRNFQQGHFVSLHASDADRQDVDFLEAIGYAAAQFPDVEDVVKAPLVRKERAPRPRALRTITAGKLMGMVAPSLQNITQALSNPLWVGMDIRFDEFAGELVINEDSLALKEVWRPFKDTDYSALRMLLEGEEFGFAPIARQDMRDAVHLAAENRRFDTAREWLNRLKWDGTPRIARFFADYFGAADNDYTGAVSLYVWTALAGRVQVPGSKADMMPILVGDQGCGKSTGVAAIAPDTMYFTDAIQFTDKEDDHARKIRGVLVAEYSEMNGLKTRAIESIKASLSRTHEKWVAKYQENASHYARRCIYFGTSNDDELLDDGTGARRFLPLTVGQVDVKAIERDRDQLWAEARHVVAIGGIQHANAERLAVTEHAGFSVIDDLQGRIADWLDTEIDLGGQTPRQVGEVTTRQIIDALGMSAGLSPNRASETRVGKVLRCLKCKKTRRNVKGNIQYLYAVPKMT